MWNKVPPFSFVNNTGSLKYRVLFYYCITTVLSEAHVFLTVYIMKRASSYAVTSQTVFCWFACSIHRLLTNKTFELHVWWHQTVQVITCISPHSDAVSNHYYLLQCIYCNTDST